MSIRKVSERIKEQNELLVEMSQDNQKNSESLQQSIGELNAVLSSIHKVLLDQDQEEETEKSRETLQGKDEEKERKSLFSGFLGQREDKGGKKDGKGMLAMIGKIFTKALGFLVKSLPLIGLASLFFGDVVTGLLTAALGDYDQASILKNIIAGGLIGSLLGFRGALIGAIVGFLFSEATWSGLKDRWNELVSAFSAGDWEAIKSAAGGLVGALGILGGAILALDALTLGVAGRLARRALRRGPPAPVGGPMGPPLPPGPAPNPGQRQPTPRGQGRVGRALGGLRALGGRAVGKVGSALVMTPMLASVGASAIKDGVSTAAKSAGSVIKSGASVAASAGGSVAKTVAGGMAGTSAKTVLKKIPVIGALAGLGFGASRLIGGDVTGAGMEVLSGLASVVPGIGTAASLGIDAALIARDAGVFDKKSQEIETARNIKSEALNEATRERDELVAKTSSNVIMDNSTTNNVSSSGGGGVSISSPITFFDDLDPYLNSGR